MVRIPPSPPPSPFRVVIYVHLLNVFSVLYFQDKRYHIVEELYKNEREYVEALRTLKDAKGTNYLGVISLVEFQENERLWHCFIECPRMCKKSELATPGTVIHPLEAMT
ncbi:hypothetical protein PoB_007416400 [Plakobranchus ocellatus]|uniref:DH domain-containing protein n=1 Tax=Plakobranchus ocellatus TaxID=259542 RepID=A0AAV4DU26_9GAST|nr:hypothetical protein PoB_007416400 [Plakobranchus ocellatus]